MADDRRPLAFGLTGMGALVALLAIAFRVSPTASSAPTGSVPAAPRPVAQELARVNTPTEAIQAFDRGQRLLADFFGTSWNQQAGWKSRAYEVNAVIATIPDPYDSHQDWFYDAYLESFRRAFAAAGYVPDRHWIPARDDSIAVKVPSGAYERVAADEYFPGVILFRQSNPNQSPHRLWLLYLAFETPTTGIQKNAFRAAVSERNTIVGDSVFVADPLRLAELLVAGPVFSGSALSLRLALDEVLTNGSPARTARVISGSATASSNHAVLTDSSRVAVRVRTSSSEVDSVVTHRIRYSSTVHTDDAMLIALRDVLHDLGIEERDVALLSESSTQYGAPQVSPGRIDSGGTVMSNYRNARSSIAARRSPADSPRAGAGSPPAAATAATASGILRIPFPLNIASLRSEFERTRSPNDQTPDLPGLSTSPRTRLSLDERSRRESPPVTSDLTVPTLDLVMSQIFRVLEDRGTRAVIIQATDIRDKLTLAREIKRRLRSMQLFTLESHLLFIRPEFSQYLDGMYIVSTYPLLLDNQWWSPRADAAYDRAHDRPLELLAFPNDASLGGYNALVSLLSTSRSQLEYRMPFRETEAAAGRPPLWLTIIGRDAPYPLRLAGPSPRDGSHPQRNVAAADTSRIAAPPVRDAGIWQVVAWLSLVLVTALSWASLRPDRFERLRDRLLHTNPEEVLDRNSATYASATPSPESLTDDQRLFSGVFACAVQCAFVPPILLLALATGAQLLVVLVLGLGILIAGFGCWRLSAGNWGHFRLLLVPRSHRESVKADDPAPQSASSADKEPRNNHVGHLLIGLVAIGYVYFSLLLCVAILELRDNPQAFAFFSYRTLHPWSGVSLLPAVMLLGTGFALWSGWQLFQVRTAWTSRSPYEVALLQIAGSRQLELRGDDEDAILAVNEARKALLWLIPDRRVLILAAALLAFGTLIVARRATVPDSLVLPPVLGATPADWVLWLGLFSLVTTTSWGIARLFLAWKAVELALDTLAETPTLDAVRRLPKRARALSRIGLIGVPSAPKIAAVASEMLRRAQAAIMELRVASGPTAVPPTQLTTLIELEPLLPTVSELDVKASAPTATRLSQMQRTSAVNNVFVALRKLWPDPRTPGAPPSSTGNRAQSFLEEYLATEALIFVHSTLRNFRWLALLLLAALISIVVISSSYPLQPEGVLKFAVVAILLTATGTILTVVTQMNRNDLLSVVAGTEPGKVSWDTTFALNLGLFAIVPLLAYLSTTFPEVRSFLFSWIEPTLRAIPTF
ncbi:MAG: hypothetical protein MNPFHGCM_00176 [Gemmatimonadaceae bacterium]|nr:hypothetical protein [Gemmatimonadaceae bacterium]